jgi:GNAT-family acetyltransferase (TIGR03103 family)
MSKSGGGPRRIERREALTLRSWGDRPIGPDAHRLPSNVIIDCGWGRLLFGHTFEDPQLLADELRKEEPEKRDLAFYVRDPHVVVGLAPQELFLDPSHTYRLWLATHRAAKARPRGFMVRRLRTMEDAEATNRIYSSRDMVTVQPAAFLYEHRRSKVLTYFVAVDRDTEEVIGTVTGIDHERAFGDPEQGSSLWCLAVDPQTSHPGVGLALVQQLAEHFVTRGRAFMDLSVMHHNTEAIGLYEKLGFQRVQVFCVKHKNPINEQLFVGPASVEEMNPYAMIIVNEARRRGISVDVHDADTAIFSLSYGGRSVRCRESLSDLTTAVGMTICDDKGLTHEFLGQAGVRVPAHRRCGTAEENAAFLEQYGRIVVKPARGEQGVGISVDVRTPDEMETALARAETACERVLLEQYVEGEDLRVIVIDDEVVAAAVRRPPRITGTGRHTVRQLIDKQSRRRAAATGGESTIPIDDETERCVRLAGHALDDVLPPEETILVRKTANVHTGGTIHDVTPDLHPQLATAAVTAARALQMPVVGLDLIVPAVDRPEYVVVEANERPGLANHEPQPTAERFIDLLFPQTAIR